jgi:hypothetical protein
MATYDTLKTRYESGRITLAMLRVYVQKGLITSAELKEMTGEGKNESEEAGEE